VLLSLNLYDIKKFKKIAEMLRIESGPLGRGA